MRLFSFGDGFESYEIAGPDFGRLRFDRKRAYGISDNVDSCTGFHRSSGSFNRGGSWSDTGYEAGFIDGRDGRIRGRPLHLNVGARVAVDHDGCSAERDTGTGWNRR